MSGIPEYKPRKTLEQKTGQPPLRKISGILALVAGVILFIGFLLDSVNTFIASSTLFAKAGSTALAVIAGIIEVLKAITLLVIGVFTLIASIIARRENPARIARQAAFIWALLAILASIFFMLLIGFSKPSIASYTNPVLLLVSSILIVLAAALVRLGASLASWLAGSIMGLVGLVLLLVAYFLESTTLIGGLFKVAGLSALGLVGLQNIFVLIGAITATISLIAAPFLGRARLWIAEIIALIGVLVALSGITYESTLGFIALYNLASLISLGGELTLETLVLITNLTSLLLLAIGAILGIASGALAIAHLATTSTKQPEIQAEKRESVEKPSTPSEPEDIKE